MGRPPEVPDVGECPEDIESKIREATNGIDYGPGFVNAIALFVRENAKPLFAGQTSFFLLGSYDDHPIRRLQFAETQLNSRRRTYAFLLCDLLDPGRFETDDTDEQFETDGTDEQFETDGTGSGASETDTDGDEDTARELPHPTRSPLSRVAP